MTESGYGLAERGSKLKRIINPYRLRRGSAPASVPMSATTGAAAHRARYIFDDERCLNRYCSLCISLRNDGAVVTLD